jgi:hypothetical protein
LFSSWACALGHWFCSRNHQASQVGHNTC